MPNLLASITSVTSGTAPGTFADVPALSAVVNVASVNSVVLLIAQIPTGLDKAGLHSSAIARFTRAGSRVGPEVWVGYEDGDDVGIGGGIVHAVTGVSGSQTFAVQWQDGASDTPATLDTGRPRSFQIIELLDGEANLLVDIELTTSGTAPGTYANIPGFTASPTVDSAASVLLMIANMSTTLASDATADMQFAVGGVREGPEMTWFYNDNAIEKAGSFLSHIKTGISGVQTLSCQWQDRSGSPTIMTAHPRTFQVIELLNTSILLNIESVTSGTAPATYANVPSLSGTPTVGDSGSVVLMGANVPITLEATDKTADFQFADGGVREGPELTAQFTDNTDEGGGGGMMWAKTGISGSRTFSIQWQDRAATPTLDTGRTRSFYVLELESLVIPPQVIPVGQASETNLAQAFTITKIKGFGQASETNLAQVVTPIRVMRIPVGQASEINLAQKMFFPVALADAGLLFIRILTTEVANVVPVEFVTVFEPGVVRVREAFGTLTPIQNVVPVRETLETPRVKVILA